MSTTYRVSMKAIIQDYTGKILLCKESNGRRELPGGGRDLGETPHECIHREIEEEMGIQVTYIDPHPCCVVQRKDGIQRVNICYRTAVANLDLTLSDECVEIGFFDKNKLISLDIFENITKIFDILDHTMQ